MSIWQATPVSIEERAFLERLSTHPQDVETRLVYADWLEELGEKDQAEYERTCAEIIQEDTERLWPDNEEVLDSLENLGLLRARVEPSGKAILVDVYETNPTDVCPER